jgi:hypothetical protein
MTAYTEFFQFRVRFAGKRHSGRWKASRGRCPAAQLRRSRSFKHDQGGVVLGQAQIETDAEVRLRAELLDWRSGLEVGPGFFCRRLLLL